MQDFEQQGTFFLGRRQGEPDGAGDGELLLYDAKDLTTHAICVGMTGSGKTGLGIGLLEEAALDGIPAIVVDPKGDMANLLLTFPDLLPADFAPWIDPAEAARKRVEPAELARTTAEEWRKGLAEWGMDGARIVRLRAAAEFTIYTPGSTAARPIRVLKSFDAPPAALRDDPEALNERVVGSVSGLLALLGIDADPIQSREAILLSNIVQRAWNEGRDLDLEELIRAIQDPPFERLGVLDVDSFFPAKERFRLALALNNLLASPGFAAWLEGDALDAGRLLWNEQGKPRISILSIAHLSDAERMFFVTMLLNELLAWVRTQPGTSSLRALFYMDEIFGFFPPTQSPPAKKPMLTLLKQARAYGLGIVLATQNPVDLDYKGLSNTGTWFLGRLQTERDKLRVLDGLEGALRSGGRSFDRGELDLLLSGLGKRVFLMHNVHQERPVLFRTRWALSYLHGPLSRSQLRSLSAAGARVAPPAPEASPRGAQARAAQAGGARPLLGPGIEERFARAGAALAAGERRLYRPALFARARLHHVSARERVDAWSDLGVLVPLAGDTSEPLWDEAHIAEGTPALQLDSGPEPDALFVRLPPEAAQAKSFKRWGKELVEHLYRHRPLVLYKSPLVALVSAPGETEASFRLRVGQSVREKRYVELEELRQRHAARLASAKERVRKARERAGKEEEQLSQKKKEGWIAIGSSLFSALFSRKLKSAGNVGRASTAARSLGRTAKERADVERAERDLAVEEAQLVELEAELAREVSALEERFQPATIVLEEELVPPRKSDLDLSELVLLWTPWTVAADGAARPAFRI